MNKGFTMLVLRRGSVLKRAFGTSKASFTKIDDFIARNKAWAESMKKENPNFFNAARTHSPSYLWIGCSDARVPAQQLLNLNMGELFVHRNVGNVVSPLDFNVLSVIQFSVRVLKVKDIIVCGHYGCGAVRFASQNQGFGLIDGWLRRIRDLRVMFMDELNGLSDQLERPNEPSDDTNLSNRHRRLVELNTLESAVNVLATPYVRKAHKQGDELNVHAVVYSMHDGLLKKLDIEQFEKDRQSQVLKLDYEI